MAKTERLFHQEGVRLSRRACRLAGTDISPCMYCMRERPSSIRDLTNLLRTARYTCLLSVCLISYLPCLGMSASHRGRGHFDLKIFLPSILQRSPLSVVSFRELVLHEHILFAENYQIPLFSKLLQQHPQAIPGGDSSHPLSISYTSLRNQMHLLIGYTIASDSGESQDMNASGTLAVTAMAEPLKPSPPDRHHEVLPVCILSRSSGRFKGVLYRDVPPH